MFDFVIIGGGILGLSTAWALRKRYPGTSTLILEKESAISQHQTGNNSGVIHSGIYYEPGSLKSNYAKRGGAELVKFCHEQGIDYEICGKVIVATGTEELPVLDDLYQKGLKNELDVKKMGSDELREHEPHVKGLAGIHAPSTGIVDYGQVAEAFAALIKESGGEISLGTEILEVVETAARVEIATSCGSFQARTLINCAGLYSDRVAEMCGVVTGVKIVPFRGEYYDLVPEKRYLVRNLIYPVPDPSFPFLGVHLTRTIGGAVHVGPNAVLGFAREGYDKSIVNLKDFAETLTYPAFWRLAGRYWRTGAAEISRSFSKRLFVKNLQRLVPEIEERDVVQGPAGVRAQALTEDGRMVDDFLILEGQNSIHVLNAPSPAATASLPIGESIADRLSQWWHHGNYSAGG